MRLPDLQAEADLPSPVMARLSAAEKWEREVFPNDLGDGEHRWSWLMEASNPAAKNLMWLHRCVDGKRVVCRIDLTSGTKHHLVKDEPLTIEPSVLCPIGCGDHGFVREGRWVAA